MAAKKWFKTTFPGVRYRKHPTRKNGVKKDQYFSIRYKLNGKDVEEGVGWASEKVTAAGAFEIVSELKKNIKAGTGPRTLAEKRAVAEEERREQERDALTFGEVFEKKYLPAIKPARKNPKSWEWEDHLFKVWIKPVIGDKAFKEIAPIHLEKVKSHMAGKGKAPRSIQYALAVVRQVFNFARTHDLYHGESPTRKVKTPKFDNARLRFLTREEARNLLADLVKRSPDVHDMSLLSLHCGLRFGEIVSLTWGDVDLPGGILTLRDTKNSRTRRAIMTEAVKTMLDARPKGGPTDMVFSTRKGDSIGKISHSFRRAVVDLGLNTGIEDRRQKVVFHTLRHTYCSWLVEAGIPLFTVANLAGHRSLSMAERYSHLAPDTLRNAVNVLNSTLEPAPAAAEVVELKN